MTDPMIAVFFLAMLMALWAFPAKWQAEEDFVRIFGFKPGRTTIERRWQERKVYSKLHSLSLSVHQTHIHLDHAWEVKGGGLLWAYAALLRIDEAKKAVASAERVFRQTRWLAGSFGFPVEGTYIDYITGQRAEREQQLRF